MRRETAQRGQHPQLGRPEQRASVEHRLPGAHVVARVSDLCTRGHRHEHLHPAIVAARVLDAHDRVGARREHRPCGDRDRLPGAERRGGRRARARLVNHSQSRGAILTCRCHIVRSHREAVHRGVIESRHRLSRAHVLSEHTPERRLQLDWLARQGLHGVEHQALRVLDLDQPASHLAWPL